MLFGHFGAYVGYADMGSVLKLWGYRKPESILYNPNIQNFVAGYEGVAIFKMNTAMPGKAISIHCFIS